MMQDYLSLSKNDLYEDLNELKYLIDSSKKRILAASIQITKSRFKIQNIVFTTLTDQLKYISQRYVNLLTSIEKVYQEIASVSQEITFLSLVKEKNSLFAMFRLYTHLAGSIITASDWQSPSYSHSLESAAGRQTGQIAGTINDYKRDVHLDEKTFEKEFVKEYIDGRFKFNIHAYLTSSGMAAFTTILTYLQASGKLNGKILIGKNVYFQYKQILLNSFTGKIIIADESETEEIYRIIKNHQPIVYFLDSLCNCRDIEVPNLNEIIPVIDQNSQKETYIIVDNTCMSVFYQPFKLIRRNRDVHLISFESLNKYYQFGLDRVTAGIVIVYGNVASGIFEYRKHAGTNISDNSVFELPKPKRELLEKRLSRLNRNASHLALSLHEHLSASSKRIIEKVIYPGLDKNWVADLPFHGSFFNLQFSDAGSKTEIYNRFIKSVLSEARKQQVQIVAGTSFGLNQTRIYLTSLWSSVSDQFLRVSAGTESVLEIEKIKSVFIKVINKFNK